ncbi:GntR family transcriptional regulator [Antarcticimicrobium sediminis]|uniref:GntR family transcriptional regulator n=1 Tax=Antarcticimicrobium sediminis TaxID=2546227 RepID=A0A4R5ENB0_9RHOB|nr:GntR family transcriptional regulator [Antarcticimicrobium sediminis]TDE36195.1 GntR family transcriptional regulator [Antarcticimicrobium sediminis]
MALENLPPVTRQSTETIVTETLRDYLLSGEISPGERLTEISLADRLGVARSTVRTALHRLNSEGIVRQIPYTGWEVASLTAKDVWELWTLRGALESLAARLAAGRKEPEIRADLVAAHDRLITACHANDLPAIIEADFEFHRRILAASGHHLLTAQYRVVEFQVRLFIATSNTHIATGPDDIIAQHEPLMSALLDGDAERASQEAWLHDEKEGRRLMDWLAGQAAAT